MKRLIALFLSIFTAVAFCATTDTPVVKELTILNDGPGVMDEGFVRMHITTAQGAVLDRQAVAKDVRSLLDTKRFSDVRVEVAQVNDGVKVVFHVAARWRLIEPPTVSGQVAMTEAKIRDILNVGVGDLVDEQLLASRAMKIRQSYADKRMPLTTVATELIPVDKAQGTAKANVAIKEGAYTWLAGVVFAGNTNVSSGTLKSTLDLPSKWWPWNWFRSPSYERDTVETARLMMRDIYMREGYLDATVAEPVCTTAAGGGVIVAYHVNEGPLYRFGRATVGGSAAFNEDKLSPLLAEMRAGEVARSDTVDRVVRAVRDYFGSRGYAYTAVRPIMDRRTTPGVVNVHIAVTDGQPTNVRDILIRGNSVTKDKVIRRELLVFPGDSYNEPLIRRSERIVNNLGYFESVRSYLESTTVPGSEDLVFEVEEKRTGNLMIGGGFSSTDKGFGYLEISQNNFDLTGWPNVTGGGQRLALKGYLGEKREEVELSLTEPWFLDRKLSLGVETYYTKADYNDYDLKKIGASVGVGQPLVGGIRMDLRYRLERVEMTNIDDTNEYYHVDSPTEKYFFADESQDRVESSMTLTLSHDSRDNPFLPRRGARVSVFGGVSGGVLGFDTDIYRAGARFNYYVPVVFNHYLGFNGRYEMVEEYGDTDEVPIGNRLFAGGGRTIRGFEYRDVGPKVKPLNPNSTSKKYRPVGGKSLAVFNAEYSIPLAGPLRLAGFFDAGNVWREVRDTDFSNLAMSRGVGLRIDIPFFPISIDRAWVIRKDDPITDTEEWVFSIGRDF